MRTKIIAAMLLAVLLVVPIQSLDAEVHMGGEGHGEGIDVVYSSGDDCLLTVTLAQRPTSYPTVSVLALDGSGDDQVVEHVEPAKVFTVILTPLHKASYQVIVTIAETGELLGECILTVGGSLTVSFFANGGSGRMAPMEVEPGSQVVLPDCGFTPAEGRSFKAWEIGGREYAPGDKVVVTEDIRVMALWDTRSCIITYLPGDGSGAPVKDSHPYGTSVMLKDCMFTSPDDRSFDGWTIDGKTYRAGDAYIIDGDVSAVARWGGDDGFPVIAIVGIAVVVALAMVVVFLVIRRRT